MGWWGIVLIQQTDAAETELPFWRRGRSQLFPESTQARDLMDHGGSRAGHCGVVLGGRGGGGGTGMGEPTVLRAWRFLQLRVDENTCQ